MGKLLMTQQEDDDRIEQLKKNPGIIKKIDVIRTALTLLEKEAERIKRIKRWKNAVKLVSKSSHKINKEFERHSRIKSE